MSEKPICPKCKKVSYLTDCVHCRKTHKNELSEYQSEVGMWARKTFPEANSDSWVAHLAKEVVELKESHNPEEAADCFILLLGYAHINGFDLLEEAKKKMKINKKRIWGMPDKEGVVEHV